MKHTDELDTDGEHRLKFRQKLRKYFLVSRAKVGDISRFKPQ